MKIRVYKSYLVFVLGVTLVVTLTLIEVPCPIDGGTGVIARAQGLEITGIEHELIEYGYYDTGCGLDFEQYTYAVNISVVNETTTLSQGAIIVTFYDPEETQLVTHVIEIRGESGAEIIELAPELLGPPKARIPIFVEIPAETAKTIEQIVEIGGFFLPPGKTHRILVEIAEEITCPYSGGTGKVTITEWLRIKASVH